MKHLTFPTMGLLLFVLTALPALAQETKPRRTPLGLDLGVYLPAASQTKALFGSKWMSLGPGIGTVASPMKGSFRTNFDVLMASKDGNKATLIPIGFEYRLPVFGGIIPIPSGPPPGTDARQAPGGADQGQAPPRGAGGPPAGIPMPYLSFGANAYATQLRVESLGIASKWRGASGFTGAIGVTFGERASVELRYRTVSRVQGIDLSGGQLRFGLRF